MKNKAMRKIVDYAVRNELHKPKNSEFLEEALSGCMNPTTRARLRSKILRAGANIAVAAVGFFLFGCSSMPVSPATPKVVAHAPFETRLPGNVTISDQAGKPMLSITADGRSWTWSAPPEDVIAFLLIYINQTAVATARDKEGYERQLAAIEAAKTKKHKAKTKKHKAKR